VILQGVRRPKSLKSSFVAFTVVLLVFLVIYPTQTASGAKAKRKPKGSAGVSSAGSYEAPVDLDPGTVINALVPGADETPGSIAKSSDPCFGPARPSYDIVDTRPVFGPPPPSVKPGTSTTAPKPIRMEKLVQITCNGKVLRSYWKCLSTPALPCPPAPKPLDPLKIAVSQFKSVSFEPPLPDFYPKPSDYAPLVGVGFFYGVDQDQFDRKQIRHLTACNSEDCATILLEATPIGVYFDPGNGRPLQKDCNYAGPGVYDKIDARDAGTECRFDYQRAGKYRTVLKMLYEVRPIVVLSTIDQYVVPPTTNFFGTTSTPFVLTVRQRQPVVIG
jgi:hypothetical protein